jgi:hypothetical protein
MSTQPHHLLSLLQTGFTTIKVRFPADLAPASTHPAHSRTTGQPLDQGQLYTYKHMGAVYVGDTVVVDSPHSGLCCVRVVEVDDTPRIDLSAKFVYKWTVQRVDKTEYLAMLDREEKFTGQVAELQRAQQRQALLMQHASAFPVGTPAREEFDRAVAEFNPALAAEMKTLAGTDAKPAA